MPASENLATCNRAYNPGIWTLNEGCGQVRLGALIAQGDLERLLGQARGFVDKGFRVKLVVRFGHWQRANGEQRLKAVVEQVRPALSNAPKSVDCCGWTMGVVR